MATQAHTIDSVGDALHIRKRIFDLIQDAELAEDADERRRLLTFAVMGSGQRACATAVEICALLRTAEVSYPVLREQGWQVHLYEDTKVPFSDFEAQIQARRDRELKKAGIKLCGNDQIAALTNRSITLTNGERRPVGMVVNAAFKWPAVRLSEQDVHWPPETGVDLSLKGHESIWVPSIKQPQGERRRFMTAADLAMLGRTVGYNAWARSQNYPPRPYRLPKRLFKPYNMGQHSLCSVFGLLVRRTPGWFLSRLSNLLVLPGLERNLRILIDWLLDIPFRNDIAVLGPDLIERLHRKHFEAGEEVISEGDMGETAYIVEVGRLAVFKGRTKVDELAEGDCFGEIALLSNVKRTATIRCLTACELIVLMRGDFRTLSTGQGALARAIHKQAEDRQTWPPARHLAIGM
jgi:predicted nucleic acid-binding protein